MGKNLGKKIRFAFKNKFPLFVKRFSHMCVCIFMYWSVCISLYNANLCVCLCVCVRFDFKFSFKILGEEMLYGDLRGNVFRYLHNGNVHALEDNFVFGIADEMSQVKIFAKVNILPVEKKMPYPLPEASQMLTLEEGESYFCKYRKNLHLLQNFTPHQAGSVELPDIISLLFEIYTHVCMCACVLIYAYACVRVNVYVRV